MEHNPKKSKAFIITFILILILLLVGYYLYKNRTQIFDTQGSTSVSKIFSPLFGTPKIKPITVIDDGSGDKTGDKKGGITGTIIIDVNGNKIVLSEAGENLKKGDVVYIAGFNSNNQPVVMKAIANDKNKSLVFGVVSEDTTKGSIAKIIIEGVLSGINTSIKEGTLWAKEDPLYLSDKILGGMTKNPPLAPSFVVPVGSVITVDPVSGSIYVGDISSLIKKEVGETGGGTGGGSGSINGNIYTNLLKSSNSKINDFWSSIFGNNSYRGMTGLYDINDPTLNWDYTGGEFSLNPINIPNIHEPNPPTMRCQDPTASNFGSIGTCSKDGNVCKTTTATNYNKPLPCVLPTTAKCQDSTASNYNLIGTCEYAKSPDVGKTCKDTAGNDADNYPDCTTKNGACVDPKMTNYPKCDKDNTKPNICKAVADNPLTFTDAEKTRLDALLRKFYLISSTLRTSDDIETIYNELDQQLNFIEQTKKLTAQCYLQTNDAGDYAQFCLKNPQSCDKTTDFFNRNYSGPTLRHGNPWFTKQSGGSFPYTNGNTGYSEVDAGSGIDVPATERILNIW